MFSEWIKILVTMTVPKESTRESLSSFLLFHSWLVVWLSFVSNLRKGSNLQEQI